MLKILINYFQSIGLVKEKDCSLTMDHINVSGKSWREYGLYIIGTETLKLHIVLGLFSNRNIKYF